MENQTTVLFLTRLSDLPNLQVPLFLVFLLIYLFTLTINLLILLLIFTDSHLHTPMYFFLGTLACLDLSYSSVTVPRMLYDLLTGRRDISLPACITQIYFLMFFAVSEMAVLAVMSYDRYIAICRSFFWVTFYPYISIIMTVLKIPSINMRSKAFSTCSSHLTVVFIFYSTIFFNYFSPNSKYHVIEDKVASVVYAILTPLLNPVIYSLRNQELKTSLRRSLHRL
ncbi:olfactory receptor 5B12-like [Xenopus tropicalis]|uniref:Olfactory receptor 5B12-like n=1 Tax=Xenopus tropicalis TaxID=8364 RepID=A0A8J1IYU6_XENTR|nr:olfactory receptor 5B12-like [Xenopus tropicalis]